MATPKPPLEDLNDLPPRWLIALGSAVHGLIQRFDAMPRFREMVKGWVAQHEAEKARRAEWEERRRRHFMHAVIRSPRLRNRAKKPPEPDWVFETYSVPNLRAKDSDGSPRPVHVTGWVPPDLSYTSKPPVTPLLPLKADRALSLVEKYTLLAAIHDYACAGEEKINPWHNESPSAISKTLSLRWCLSLDFYRRGRRKLLPAVATKQEPVLRGFLADVEKDLTEWVGKAAATPVAPVPPDAQQSTGAGATKEEAAAGGDLPKATPQTHPNLIYQADGAEFYNIPKSVLCKAAKKKPGEPGYLWSGRGRIGKGKKERVWHRRKDLETIARSRKALGRASRSSDECDKKPHAPVAPRVSGKENFEENAKAFLTKIGQEDTESED
jgi:hypothetical protein